MFLHKLRWQLLAQYLLTVGVLLAVAEVGCYSLVRWAGARELDTDLGKIIEKLEAAVELERYRPRLDGLRSLKEAHGSGHSDVWQVLVEDGTTLERSRNAGSADLPAVGGNELAVGELHIADSEGPEGVWVRAARKRVVRQRLERGPPPKPPPPPSRLWSALGFTPAPPPPKPRPVLMPAQMTFDLRAAVDRTALDERLRWLAWGLAGGFPLLLGLAAVGGIYLIRRAVRPVELAFDRERRFSGAASHELRTPLTALRAEIEITLRRERRPEDYVAVLRRMEGLVGQMTGLVEGLLILARAQAGQLLSGVGEVPAAAVRGAIENSLRLLPRYEQVRLTAALPEQATIRGDPLLLALAVRNLVENALNYGPESPVQVDLTCPPGERLRVAVRDTGPGIPPEVLGQQRAAGSNGTPVRRGNGEFGLGLSIARAVVEAHGGRLALANQADAGCLAVISLPVDTGPMNRGTTHNS